MLLFRQHLCTIFQHFCLYRGFPFGVYFSRFCKFCVKKRCRCILGSDLEGPVAWGRACLTMQTADWCTNFITPCSPCGSAANRPRPPAPQHDVMVSAGSQVLGFGSAGCSALCWLAGLWMSARKVSFDFRGVKLYALLIPTPAAWEA